MFLSSTMVELAACLIASNQTKRAEDIVQDLSEQNNLKVLSAQLQADIRGLELALTQPAVITAEGREH